MYEYLFYIIYVFVCIEEDIKITAFPFLSPEAPVQNAKFQTQNLY